MTNHSYTPFQNGAMANRGTNELVLVNPGASAYNYLTNNTVLWVGNGDFTLTTTTVPDPNGPTPCIDAAMSYDGTSSCVLFGGRGGSSTAGVYNSTWRWNGTSWSSVATTSTPLGRYKHEMATLTQGNFLFGGINGNTLLQDSYILGPGGTAWSQQTQSVSNPPARSDFQMASNGTDTVIMFGGAGSSNLLQDTWKFTFSSGWTQLNPGVVPPARKNGVLVYHAGVSKYFLINGQNQYNYLNDIWVFDPIALNWSLANTSTTVNPAARIGHAAAYSTGTGAIIMLGGQSATTGTNSNETWSLNGNGDWSKL